MLPCETERKEVIIDVQSNLSKTARRKVQGKRTLNRRTTIFHQPSQERDIHTSNPKVETEEKETRVKLESSV